MPKIEGLPPEEVSSAPEALVADAVDTGRLDGASGRRVVLVVLAIILAIELVPFQIVLVTLGAQKIGAAFPAAGNQTAWILTIWGLVGGAVTPLFGKLSDIIGKKNVMTFSLLVAGAGLLIDALTTSWPLFLVGRALAGFAFPAIIISYGLIRDLVPRKWVSTAVAFVAGGSGLTGVLGPVIGGLLSDHYSWRSFFWFMLIFAAVTVPIFVLLVPETKLRTKQKLDLVGAAILAAGVALILLYLNEGQSWGWGRPATLGWLLGGLALLIVFPFWERTRSAPLVDLGLVRARRVWTVLLVSGLATTISVGITYALNYMAQTPGNTVRQGVIQGVAAQAGQALHTHLTPAGLKALGVGITFNDPLRYALGLSLMQVAIRISLTMTVITVIVAPVAGWLFMKTGVYRPMIVAFLAISRGYHDLRLLPLQHRGTAACRVSRGPCPSAPCTPRTPTSSSKAYHSTSRAPPPDCSARQAPSAPPWDGPSSPSPRSPTRSVSSSRHRAGSPPSLRSRRSTLTAATRRRS